MLLLRKPSEDQIRRFLLSQSDQPFSYAEVGMTRSRAPAGYNADHNLIELGEGAQTFARAVEAMRNWKMFALGWVKLFYSDAPIEPGTIVCVCVHHFGFWSLNACRVVYVVDEDGPIKRYGFAYGTLTDHAERGEERFILEWNHEDDSVVYDILAFSRPGQFFAKLGYPFTRALQKRFARDSKQAMLRAVTID
ncbi:MAG TPA: DUF1990 domain-containing protein [Blastocatellia bacterium]|nr:DUF1990 domain-containing protein [Blastocatellia bacterium]